MHWLYHDAFHSKESRTPRHTIQNSSSETQGLVYCTVIYFLFNVSMYVVVGAGVIGITTAYMMARAGLDVMVIEKNDRAAIECTFSNGAQLSYTHAEPWASIGNIKKSLKWIFKKDAPLLFRPQYVMRAIPWVAQFVHNARPKLYKLNTQSIIMLNYLSRDVLNEMQKDLNIDFDYRDSGILHVYKNEKMLDQDLAFFEKLKNLDPRIHFQLQSREEVIKADSSLAKLMKRRASAILCKHDAVGNAYKFTVGLAKLCEELGVKFSYNTEVINFERKGNKVSHIITSKGKIKVSGVVVANGAMAGTLVKKLGIHVPIYPMKGYSLSVKITNKKFAPISSVTDHYKKIVFSRIGDILRVGGTAEFAGFNHTVNKERIAPLLKATKLHFSQCTDISNRTYWACLRPQTPSSRPYICETKVPNVYLNVGPGSLGWTQAMGSAKLITEIITGAKPSIPLELYKL